MMSQNCLNKYVDMDAFLLAFNFNREKLIPNMEHKLARATSKRNNA